MAVRAKSPLKCTGKSAASGGKDPRTPLAITIGGLFSRKGLRIAGAVILLVFLVWTALWQFVVVPVIRSSNRPLGAIDLKTIISYVFWRPDPPDADDKEDMKILELNRDPCPKAEHQFPVLDLVAVTLKSVSWAPIKNRWQADMDTCKCRPNPGVESKHSEPRGLYDIRAFGAVGDGKKDDSVAISLAFHAACTYSQGGRKPGTVTIPASCFYIKPLDFTGPCGSGVRFLIEGTLLGPLEPKTYPPAEFTSPLFPYTNGLLTFRDFRGLVIEGSGVIEGQGFIFWEQFRQKTLGLPIRPFAVRLMSCTDTTIRGITLRNSPMYHLFAYNCRGLRVSGITTHSPGNSPNTDSMKLVGIEDCHISDCRLHGGDDDVSIVAMEGMWARNVTIENIRATSGHGISIGSVGWNQTYACVSDILVRNVTLKQLTHGVRIKSWRGGRGIVRNVRYENVKFKDTGRPIALNQFYCDAHQNWTCGDNPNNVVLFNITYVNLTGTVIAAKYHHSGIEMRCSPTVPCTKVSLKGINLTPSKANRRSSISRLTPIVENVRESWSSDVNILDSASWGGNGLVTRQQAQRINQMASACGFQNLNFNQRPSVIQGR